MNSFVSVYANPGRSHIQQHVRSATCCAGGGTRTLTLFRAMAPKAITYANFVTPAGPSMVSRLITGTVMVCLFPPAAGTR